MLLLLDARARRNLAGAVQPPQQVAMAARSPRGGHHGRATVLPSTVLCSLPRAYGRELGKLKAMIYLLIQYYQAHSLPKISNLLRPTPDNRSPHDMYLALLSRKAKQGTAKPPHRTRACMHAMRHCAIHKPKMLCLYQRAYSSNTTQRNIQQLPSSPRQPADKHTPTSCANTHNHCQANMHLVVRCAAPTTAVPQASAPAHNSACL
jgi:hypothetical protein